MKLLMLCREPRLYSCQRLKEAATQCEHEMDILDPNRCLLKLTENAPHFELYYQPKDGEAYLLPDYDAVLPRFGTLSTKMGCAVLRHFQAKGVYCLNQGEAFLMARDKWQSLQILRKEGISVPNSQLFGVEVAPKTALQKMDFPLIIKTLKGSQGIGVMLAEKPQSAVSILETLTQANVPVMLQDFVKEAAGVDIRCFVIGNNVVASMQRIGQEGEFRANFHRGGRAQPIFLTEEEKQLAVKATKALGLAVSGVDLIRAKSGLLVLEVNASPGLEMIEKTSGVDIALQMILYLEKMVQLQQ
ncbi:RimK family alpha-L-glutamate ligase [Rodentibacter trehalosifermentans]|uniref:Probable alpha-L-glutamate ligase n=1 Tax=Rodentibacter trehalosifermentans TaxID=1908263 RepID=A0A1V3IWV7_9PAST|nr:RimK family alpha-L-glutamate ligase [Rodentibacter trehalosifermentans]OOF46787.1 ribosomal protein S6 modification protein [Rodentibacter trehalosifermentans]OOF49600.1 ribosomal protein S6 modification protein [Rodentibacter trehalosifermentans]OOF53379.1 ribosomal protein S6 modification protein [Rodentibacter trehalosifermentans]